MDLLMYHNGAVPDDGLLDDTKQAKFLSAVLVFGHTPFLLISHRFVLCALLKNMYLQYVYVENSCLASGCNG